MEFSGLQKLAMVDYPGKLAATVFTGGATCAVPSAITRCWCSTRTRPSI